MFYFGQLISEPLFSCHFEGKGYHPEGIIIVREVIIVRKKSLYIYGMVFDD